MSKHKSLIYETIPSSSALPGARAVPDLPGGMRTLIVQKT
ncbi:hypothetical protein HMPREF3038_00352 [Akkermansia sp. KLE1797]|nr:hypothetical protein HMPREF3038_00352 [Akkermansia sp. KLE1797]KXU55054.1 hypothetical protein HMPREF3039_00779 [Akkermansia sp. KLE1798]KZA04314.1 hypothetical protein HMPREF1326_01982 [Akkermansia sp. KLE1605]